VLVASLYTAWQWSHTFAHAVTRNLPLYTPISPCVRSVRFIHDLCLSYLDPILNNGPPSRPSSRLSSTSDATKSYPYVDGLEVAKEVLREVEVRKGDMGKGSEDTAAIIGILVTFIQTTNALRFAQGKGKRDGVGDKEKWVSISSISSNIKHGVQGTFMDEGARR